MGRIDLEGMRADIARSRSLGIVRADGAALVVLCRDEHLPAAIAEIERLERERDSFEESFNQATKQLVDLEEERDEARAKVADLTSKLTLYWQKYGAIEEPPAPAEPSDPFDSDLARVRDGIYACIQELAGLIKDGTAADLDDFARRVSEARKRGGES